MSGSWLPTSLMFFSCRRYILHNDPCLLVRFSYMTFQSPVQYHYDIAVYLGVLSFTVLYSTLLYIQREDND